MRIPSRNMRPTTGVMASRRTLLFRRQQDEGGNESPGGNGTPPVTFIVIGIVVALLVFAAVFVCIRRSRKEQYSKPKPTITFRTEQVPANFDAARRRNPRDANGNPTVDRTTSVRSIITLPSYRMDADDSERVLGREGDRGGVDIIVEAPTADDDEALREEEMETLYQIRLARRQEIADREEARRLRAESRASGDTLPMEALETRQRAASRSSLVSDLREQHRDARSRRERAVSSVSYHDLGVARHDGTRIRASSNDSERMGLLSDAASIIQSVRSPSAASHVRHHSSGSVLSFDSMSDAQSPGLVRPTTSRFSTQYTGAGSSPEIIGEADLGVQDLGQVSPPDYDEVSLGDNRSGATTPVYFNEPPPDYTSRQDQTGRGRAPSILVEEIDDRVIEGDLSSATLPSPSTQQVSSDAEPVSPSSSSARPTSRGVGGTPQLPSLRIRDLPQIVIEPTSADTRTNRD